MNDPYQSNIRGSKGRPINPARRAGIVSIRDQMNREDFSRRDRIQARGIDNERGKTALRAGYTSGGSAPAPTNIGERQGLFSEMEKAGSAGITTGMRERARKLGVDDTSFNAAAGRIRTNEAFTPGQSAPTPPPTSPPATSAPASSSTDMTGLRRKYSVPSSAGIPTAIQRPGPARRINSITGMPMGTLPGDADYNPNWKNGTAYADKAPAAAPQPVVAASAPVVQKPAQPTALRKSVAKAALPAAAPAGPRATATLPAGPASSGMAALPGMPSSMSPSFPADKTIPAPPPKMRQTFMSDPNQDRKKEQAEIDARKARERAGMEEAKRISNANRGVPEWAQPHRTKSSLKWAVGKAIRAMQYEW